MTDPDRNDIPRREENVTIVQTGGGGRGGGTAILAIVLLVSPTLRIPVVVWVVVAGAIYFVTFRVVRRVAFEVIRGRGVPPPRSGDGA